ncbi:MAG: 6-phosphogluconolactonase [Syntrophorhabdaceae bacterium PtaU1.Bin034]|nr:MAG: 6-phosphogluconolactonase [Syntrophorhabdaceae bacterium PtaU1.Bin034]
MAHQVIRRAGSGRSILVFETGEEMGKFALERFRALAATAVSERGRFAAALSGGRTPVDLYLRIGREAKDLTWRNIHIFLVDERFVPYNDDRSNYGMIRETLLDAVPIPAENVYPFAVEGIDPEMSAEEYEGLLWDILGSGSDGAAPALDLAMLGMGEDGHTASLFPGSPVIHESTRLARAVPAGEGREARITLTLPMINAARNILFLVAGKAKAAVLGRVAKERDPLLPASLVRPHHGDLSFLCDREAASGLDT